MTACMNEPDLGLATVASCTVEAHALTLGVAVGVLAALAFAARRDTIGFAALGLTVVPAVWGLDVHPVVAMKPWYLAAPAVGIAAAGALAPTAVTAARSRGVSHD